MNRSSTLPWAWFGLGLILPSVLPAQGSVAEQVRAAEKRSEARIEALRQSYEARIQALEQGAVGTGGPAQVGVQRRGIGQLGQTTIFDSTFNPAISVSADFALAASDQEGSFETLNQFVLRSLELGIVGRVDPSLSYQVYLHFDEEEVEIEEAYGLFDNALPDTFMLKFGRYNLDFGKLSPIHDHDLMFLDKPQVLQEYLGGSLRGTGAELHHWFPVGDSNLLRWTIGLSNGLDGDAHSTFGPAANHDHDHDEEGAEPFGDREFENFALNGRLSSLIEIGSTANLQVGASAAWAPEERVFFEDGMLTRSANLERLILGGDIAYKRLDPATGAGWVLAGEALFSKRDQLNDMMMVENVGAFGAYAYLERTFNPRWTLGVSGGHFEHAEDDNESSWDIGSYLTCRLNEFNRLRLEVRHFDDPTGDSWGVTLQSTIILGSHGHGIDW